MIQIENYVVKLQDQSFNGEVHNYEIYKHLHYGVY